LGTWRKLMPQVAQAPPSSLPRLPPWSRLKSADIERMNRARAAAAAQ
jgi:hypothetical protein